MRVIILAAGQGKRLLPLTANKPKALLDIGGKPVVQRQIEAFTAHGIKDFAIVTGYASALMEEKLAQLAANLGVNIRPVFNPFYSVADNLASCWMAKDVMTQDFIQVNGDNVFNSELVQRLLSSKRQEVSVAINRKSSYDADDMKVVLAGDGLVRDIGKALDAAKVQAEAIGIYIFRGAGVTDYVSMLEREMRDLLALKKWFPLGVARLAQERPVHAADLTGVRWGEVDFPEDLAAVTELAKTWGDQA